MDFVERSLHPLQHGARIIYPGADLYPGLGAKEAFTSIQLELGSNGTFIHVSV